MKFYHIEKATPNSSLVSAAYWGALEIPSTGDGQRTYSYKEGAAVTLGKNTYFYEVPRELYRKLISPKFSAGSVYNTQIKDNLDFYSTKVTDVVPAPAPLTNAFAGEPSSIKTHRFDKPVAESNVAADPEFVLLNVRVNVRYVGSLAAFLYDNEIGRIVAGQ